MNSAKIQPKAIGRQVLGKETLRQKASGLLELTRSEQTAIPILYPLHAMRVSDFLHLRPGEHLHHQSLVELGLVREWSPKLGPLMFISHQWLSWSEADPRYQQLGVMQTVLRKMKHRRFSPVSLHPSDKLIFPTYDVKVSVEEMEKFAHTGFVFIDWFSMPQVVTVSNIAAGKDADKRDASEILRQAVQSIPAYVELADYFCVLAPPSEHSNFKEVNGRCTVCDLSSWCGRGWCRVEQQAAMLARKVAPMLVVTSAERQPYLLAPSKARTCRAGRGIFTCCQRYHRRVTLDETTGKEVEVETPCDKAQVGQIMQAMIQSKIKILESAIGVSSRAAPHVLFEYRFLMATAGYYLDGLIVEKDFDLAATKVITDVDEFCELYGFTSIREGEDSGWSPLRYATLHAFGRCSSLVENMLRLGADIEAPLRKEMPQVSHTKGMTILASAMAVSSSEMVKLLLANGADPRRAEHQGVIPLGNACYCDDREDTLNAFLQFIKMTKTKQEVTEIVNQPERYGFTASLIAAYYGSPKCLKILIESGLCDLSATTVGDLDHLQCGAASKAAGGPEVCRYLLEHHQDSFSVRRNDSMKNYGWEWSTFIRISRLVRSFFHKRNCSNAVNFFADYNTGNTILHQAVAGESLRIVRLLLEHGADVDLLDDSGRNPLEFSRLRGGFHAIDSELKLAMRAKSKEEGSAKPQMSFSGNRFPMYVLRLGDLVMMRPGEHVCHEELKNKLVKWEPGMLVLFLSSEWLSDEHPDPMFEQIGALQEFFKRVELGSEEKITVPWFVKIAFPDAPEMKAPQIRTLLRDGYVWWEWFCVPQSSSVEAARRREMALSSLGTYVQHSTYFMAIAPPTEVKAEDPHKSSTRNKMGAPDAYVRYKDMSTWIRDGKCALQLVIFARSASSTGEQSASMLTSPGKPPTVFDPSRYLVSLPGLCNWRSKDEKLIAGEHLLFELSNIVATRRKELIDAESEASSSRSPSSSVLRKLAEARFKYRFLLSTSAFTLVGFDISDDAIEKADAGSWMREQPTYDGFCQLYRFGKGVERDIHVEKGWTVLRYAAMHAYGRCQKLVLQLISDGHDIEAPLKSSEYKSIGMQHGVTILTTTVCFSTPNMVKLIAEHAKNKFPIMGSSGFSVLHYAAACNRGDNIETLLNFYDKKEVHFDIDQQDSTILQNTPLVVAASQGCDDSVIVLTERGAKVDVIFGSGSTLLHAASIAPLGSVKALAVLLEALRASHITVNYPTRDALPVYAAFIMFCRWTTKIFGKDNCSDLVREFARFATGATPLHFAAETGRLALASFLISQGAGSSLAHRDNLGRTPLDVAREFGPYPSLEKELDPQSVRRTRVEELVSENTILRREAAAKTRKFKALLAEKKLREEELLSENAKLRHEVESLKRAAGGEDAKVCKR